MKGILSLGARVQAGLQLSTQNPISQELHIGISSRLDHAIFAGGFGLFHVVGSLSVVELGFRVWGLEARYEERYEKTLPSPLHPTLFRIRTLSRHKVRYLKTRGRV